MSRKFENAQLTNSRTYTMYARQCTTLAMNVFEIENLNKFIDTTYMNWKLLQNGSIAFFWDDALGGLVCLPYVLSGNRDIYNRPTAIRVMSPSGYSRELKNTADKKEFVIMYDNTGLNSILYDIYQICRRLSILTRVQDVNIQQQKTPRIIKAPQDKIQSIKKMFDEIDGGVDVITAYEGITEDGVTLEDITMVLAPAPYVTDKLQEQKDKLWNEFLRIIGISNLSLTKKERHITDEIHAMQGGTIASRYSRYYPRKKAVDEINQLWGDKLTDKLKVRYYDGVPSDDEKDEENEKGVDEYYDV